MTSSRSRASTSKYAAIVALLVVMMFGGARAEAGRKRLVVLEFEGPKAEKFQADVVNLLKKSNTVLAASKWEAAADEADAAKLTEKNVKKVAAKLKVDGVVEGKIEKRRDDYIVKLKLRGKDGDVVATVDTKAEASHLDGRALRDVKDELMPAVEGLKENKGGKSGDDDADAADDDGGAKKANKKKKTKKSDDDDGGDAVADDAGTGKKSGFGKKKKKDPDADADDGDAPKEKAEVDKKKKKKDPPEDKKKPHDDDADSPLPAAKEPKETKKKKSADDDGEKPADDAQASDDGDDDGAAKKKAKKKKTAKVDEDGNAVDEGSGDGDSGESDDAAKLSPGNRALDLVAGASFTARRMSFTYSADLATPPPGYKGVPVGGFFVDGTLYPADLSHKRDDMLKNLGVTLMIDKVLKISSKTIANGMTVTLPTSEMHYAVGATFRYPFGKGALAPVIGASLRYGGQSFTITPPAGTTVDLPPNVSYSIVDPSVFLKYPASDKITINAGLGFMAILASGDITSAANYGAGTATGFEGNLSLDYMLTKNLFVRAAFDFETIGFKFKGTGMMATGRDTDPDQDVFGARDSYIGGAVTLGYAY